MPGLGQAAPGGRVVIGKEHFGRMIESNDGRHEPPSPASRRRGRGLRCLSFTVRPDGFAVRAADTYGASEGLPAYLSVRGEVLMGRRPEVRVSVGEAARIATGGM